MKPEAIGHSRKIYELKGGAASLMTDDFRGHVTALVSSCGVEPQRSRKAPPVATRLDVIEARGERDNWILCALRRGLRENEDKVAINMRAIHASTTGVKVLPRLYYGG
ncbi:hypothetical protein EYF80_032480 [Liparis tanakae]|uniref:Uncharacterized protein n=1 Tax=Liparis tanakae TaxID=230148 RepID=A0A4Z2GVB2_9TELE|nr:hypothetical protein EYF80_032480 [Liparis tanakae]